MTAPHRAPTFDLLQTRERQLWDAVDSLSTALAYGHILAWGIQPEAGPAGPRPRLSMIFPADPAMGEGAPLREIPLRCPDDAPDMIALFVKAGQVAHEVLMTARAVAPEIDTYLHQRAEVEKLRRNNRRLLVLPS